MEQYINKSALVAEIKRRMDENCGKQSLPQYFGMVEEDLNILSFLDTLEVKEVDLDFEQELYKAFGQVKDFTLGMRIAKYFYSLGLKAQHDNWKVVDNINPPRADKNKIYCVLSKKNKYLLARVINNPQDEDLLQWKCTEFPFHRYDMCEGDKYMQIV